MFLYVLTFMNYIYVILIVGVLRSSFLGKRTLSLSRKFHYIDYIFKKIKQFLKRLHLFLLWSSQIYSRTIRYESIPPENEQNPYFFIFFAKK